MFLAFQINQCYERWWEARRLWGQLTNTSRSFGRQVTTLLTTKRIEAIPDLPTAQALQQKLVYRQIAYANTLRISLRENGKISAEGWQQFSQWLDAEDIELLRKANNIPTQLILLQGKSLNSLIEDWTEQPIMMQFDDTFKQLDDLQGDVNALNERHFPIAFVFIHVLLCGY